MRQARPRDPDGVTYERWQQAQAPEAEFWTKRDPRATMPLLMRRHEPAIRMVETFLGEEAKIIEIGSGPTCLAQVFPKGITVYTDPLMHHYRRHAAQVLPTAGLVAAMGEAIPCPDETFDAAVCINALDHMMSPRTCLREIARVLKPGGHLILGIYTRNRLLLGLRRAVERILPSAGSAPHPSTYTVAEIRKELARHFHLEAAECVHRARGLLGSFHREYWVFVVRRGV